MWGRASYRFCVFPTQRLASLEQALSHQQEVNVELTQELRDTPDAAELQRTINDLESRVDTLHKGEQLAQETIHMLEDELKNLKSLEEVGGIGVVISQ